jgi:hypothetical protein
MEALRDELHALIDRLDTQQQRRVMMYVQTLTQPAGTPFSVLQQTAREIAFPPDDLMEIAAIIEREFEQV